MEQEEEEEEGRKVLCSLRGSLTHAGKERNGVRLPSDRPTDGGTDGRRRGRAEPGATTSSSVRVRRPRVRPSVRGAVGPSTVGWMEVGARFT